MTFLNDTESTINTVRLAIAGDQDAFGILIEKYSGMVTGVAYSVLGDFSRSEDAGQEAFLEAWKKRTTLQDPSKFGSWICSIARHRALDLVRHRARTETEKEIFEHHEFATNDPTVEDALVRDEEQTLVWDTLDGLPPKYRDVMVLYYRGNESVTAVADSLGESESTIRQRLHRGRAMLRKEVNSVISRTLSRTAPKAIFTAAVLGSLPGNAYAATAAAGSTGAAAVGTGKAAAGTLLSGAAIGGVLGSLGGLAGGALGTFLTYRSTPYASQRKLVIQFAIFGSLLSVVFGVLLTWLVSRQTSETPLPPQQYGKWLLTLIFGFQGTFAVAVMVFAWLYKRAKAQAQETGEAMVPEYQAVAQFAAIDRRSYSSARSLWGLPWVDIQFAERTSDQTQVDLVPARGWIAIGDRAHGRILAIGNRAIAPIAVGGQCVGVIAVGGMTVGVISCGGLAIGGFALGGVAIGGVAFGGLAAGYHAMGGAAFGWAAAVGGSAWSQGAADGGLIIAGKHDPAAAKAAIANRFIRLVNDTEWSATAKELGWVAFAAVVCVGVNLQSWVNSFAANPKASEERSHRASRQNHKTQQSVKSIAVGMSGALIGSTAWITGMGFYSKQPLAGIIPLVMYVAACGFAWKMYHQIACRSLSDQVDVPLKSYNQAVIALNIATTAGLIYLAISNTTWEQQWMRLPTIWILSQMVYVTCVICVKRDLTAAKSRHDNSG